MDHLNNYHHTMKFTADRFHEGASFLHSYMYLLNHCICRYIRLWKATRKLRRDDLITKKPMFLIMKRRNTFHFEIASSVFIACQNSQTRTRLNALSLLAKVVSIWYLGKSTTQVSSALCTVKHWLSVDSFDILMLQYIYRCFRGGSRGGSEVSGN